MRKHLSREQSERKKKERNGKRIERKSGNIEKKEGKMIVMKKERKRNSNSKRKQT